MNNRLLSLQFAQGTKEKGKGNNMYFEGNKMYSYGYHYLLAYRNHITVNGVVRAIAFRNDNGYSNTTAKHASYVGGALATHGYTIIDTIHIDRVANDLETTAHLTEETKHLLAQEYSARIANAEKRATRARKSHWIEFHMREANEAREEREILFSI